MGTTTKGQRAIRRAEATSEAIDLLRQIVALRTDKAFNHEFGPVRPAPINEESARIILNSLAALQDGAHGVLRRLNASL